MVIDYIDLYDEKVEINRQDLSDRDFKMMRKMDEWVTNDPRLFKIRCKKCGVAIFSIDRGKGRMKISCPTCRNKFTVNRRRIEYVNV